MREYYYPGLCTNLPSVTRDALHNATYEFAALGQRGQRDPFDFFDQVQGIANNCPGDHTVHQVIEGCDDVQLKSVEEVYGQTPNKGLEKFTILEDATRLGTFGC